MAETVSRAWAPDSIPSALPGDERGGTIFDLDQPAGEFGLDQPLEQAGGLGGLGADRPTFRPA